jgi:hypothetical protein
LPSGRPVGRFQSFDAVTLSAKTSCASAQDVGLSKLRSPHLHRSQDRSFMIQSFENLLFFKRGRLTSLHLRADYAGWSTTTDLCSIRKTSDRRTPRRLHWRPRWAASFDSLGRSYFGGTSSLSIQPRAIKGSVCTCASYTRPQPVHLSVRYSNPARIWTTLWTVGRARHLGQRGRPSGAVDATGSDGGVSMNPIARTPGARTTRSGHFWFHGENRGPLNLLAGNGHGLPQFKPLEISAR